MILLLSLGAIICKEMIMGICMHLACEEAKIRNYCTNECEFAVNNDEWEWCSWKGMVATP